MRCLCGVSSNVAGEIIDMSFFRALFPLRLEVDEGLALPKLIQQVFAERGPKPSSKLAAQAG